MVSDTTWAGPVAAVQPRKKKRAAKQRRGATFSGPSGPSEAAGRLPDPPGSGGPPPAKGAQRSQTDETEELLDELLDLPALPPDVKVGNATSAAAVWLSFSKLQRELHSKWDDRSSIERDLHGTEAQRLGRAWVVLIRRHVNNSIFYYYLHLTFAHLRQLIIDNGHPLAGCDSILEKGNNDAKTLKRTIMPGGSDHEAKRQCVVKYTRKGKDGKTVTKEFTRERNHGVAYQMAGLQLMKEHRNASKRGRAAKLKSEAAVETQKMKREYAIAARGNVIEQLEQFTSSAEVKE